MSERWRYHLGLPKTATTHIQQVLDRLRPELAASGIDYIPVERLRPRTDFILKTKVLGRARFCRLVQSNANSVILSEENWLGHGYEACAVPLYPRLERRLAIVAQPDSVAFLAVRHPAEFATSIFSETLRHSPERVSLEATRDAFLSRHDHWRTLADRIREYFPKLQVWRYEDYRGREAHYISTLIGKSVEIPNISDPVETQRLPQQTVEMIENMRAAGEPVIRAGLLPAPHNYKRFEMFSDREKDLLTRSYVRDLEALERQGLLIC